MWIPALKSVFGGIHFPPKHPDPRRGARNQGYREGCAANGGAALPYLGGLGPPRVPKTARRGTT